jgi:DNA-binding NtrC family response regulator
MGKRRARQAQALLTLAGAEEKPPREATMSRRLLIIGGETPFAPEQALGTRLSTEETLRYESTDWGSFSFDSLPPQGADLIVPMAVPHAERAKSFFQWLSVHPIPTPTLAILPSDPEPSLLRLAVESVDDFILWPIRQGEWIERVTRMLRPQRQDVLSVRSRLTEELGLAKLVGNDLGFLRSIERIPIIARSGSPVLITGETGTGKELCARAIHHLSKRRNYPFIPIDCGAFPDHLFENELFGHARGAFTDAHGEQKGLVAMAEGGTLFLDEIDSLSTVAQAKLLRFLQERTYKPLGADRLARADLSVIAATNQDLEALVRDKRFRPDLFFRLDVLRLDVPPLRERRADIEVLARHFVSVLCQEAGLPRKSFTPATLRTLALADWPGNVRELFNVIQRAVLFSEGSQILPTDIAPRTSHPSTRSVRAGFREARAQAIEAFEKLYVEQVLRTCQGNVTRAAREAQKDRRAFGRLVKKYQIDRRDV